MDVISIHQAGFENVVASLGTALTPEQCRLMRQYCEEVVIAYDSDTAGRSATAKAVNLLRAVGIQPRILHMKDAKDPDEYIKKFGAGQFRLLLEEADDAVKYALEHCKDGIDVTAVDGKITMMQKAVSVLADVENTMQREIYLSELARQQEIDPAVLKEQVARELRIRRGREKKQAWRAAVNQPLMRDPVNPTAVGKRKSAKAEELILCYLFRHPDAMEEIARQITPEQFVTELYARAYAVYLQEMPALSTFTFSMFSECFSADEMGALTGISARYEEIDISLASVYDAIDVLLTHHEDTISGDGISDDDFRALFERKRKQKG